MPQHYAFIKQYLEQFPHSQPFGNRLKDVFEETRLSYRQFERLTDIPYNSLWQLFNGYVNGMRLCTVLQIASALQRIPLAFHYKENERNRTIFAGSYKQFKKAVAANIRRQRENLGENPYSLSMRIDISSTTIINLEQGGNHTTTSLEKICQGLEMIPIYLI